jgi:uncharacterized protein (DUF952 family)
VGERLYHLALAQDWETGSRAYEMSTLGRSLADEGFIHCSFAHQVQGVADRFYRARPDVVLLEMDRDALTSPVQVESLGTPEAFPHVYGPINRAAVLRATPVPLLPDGRLDIPAALH